MGSIFRQQTIVAGSDRIHILQAGMEHNRAIVFLHGWPQDATAWQAVMRLACRQAHVVAVDLPGIGGSTAVGGSKAAMAQIVHKAVKKLALQNYLIVGHDIGAMVAFAYLRQFAKEIQGVVLMDSAIPGVEPWEKIVANPQIWHFAFHAIPKLPETLVMGRQRQYFEFFFDTLAKNKAALTDEAKQRYASAYTPTALSASFDWYRAFKADAAYNQRAMSIQTPLLYLRGEAEGGDMDEYARGFAKISLGQVTTDRIPQSAHFTPEENPEAVWSKVNNFMANIAKLKS